MAEDLARSLSELDEQAETLAGQERSLAGAHGLLKDLTEEINGLTLAVEDTLQGKKATLSRVTGLTKEIASRTKNLKSRQESLSGAVQEAVRTLENKDQELLALLEEMKPGVVFGDRTLGQFQDILRTQDEIIRLLGDTGRDRPPQSGYPDTRDGVPQTLPSYLQALSVAAQETALDLSRLHQGLRSLNSGPWGKQWDRVVSEIAPCRWTVEDLNKDLSAPKECPASSAVGSVEDLEAEGPWKTLSTLNEKITLLALKASLNAFRKGKTTEDLVSVLEEIRELSAQANQVLLSLAEGRQPAIIAPQGHLDPAAEPAGHPLWEAFLGKWEALLTALESAGPAVDRLKGGMKEQEGLVEKLLENLSRMLTQCQGLMDLSQEQALDLYPRSSPAGLQSSRRLKRMAQTQGVQLQELSRNLENAWSQVRPLRKLLQGTGLGHRALLSQLEEMQEAVDSQGHELLVQGARENNW